VINIKDYALIRYEVIKHGKYRTLVQSKPQASADYRENEK